jgi:putative membrane protein
MKTIIPIAVIAMLAVAPVPVLAQAPMIIRSGSLQGEDLRFATQASQDGLFVAAIATLADRKGPDPREASFAVKDLGLMLVRDQVKIDGALRAIFKSRGARIPVELDATNAALLDSLNEKQGAAFDQDFLTLLDRSLRDSVASFEAASRQCTDPELREFAAANLPMIRLHEARVREVKAAPGTPG